MRTEALVAGNRAGAKSLEMEFLTVVCVLRVPAVAADVSRRIDPPGSPGPPP